MRIAMAQINSTLGDFAGNRQLILNSIHRAIEHRCDLVVFPEASLFGYHPLDLLERQTIIDSQMREFEKLCSQMPQGIAALVGLFRPNPSKRGKPYFNSAAFIVKGRKPKFFNKELLPTYDVFDDARHIEPGDLTDSLLEYKGKRFVVTVCEDIWAWDHPDFRNYYAENPLLKIKKAKYDAVLNLSASPFAHHKQNLREYMVKKTAKLFKAPMVYVNMVGAQDELIFDGGSFAVDERGEILSKCVHFQEDFNVLDLKTREGRLCPTISSDIEKVRSALVLGIRDFANKTGFSKIHLGSSGGIDSAVVACLACDAIGPQNVTTIGMPGPYNSPESLELARKLAENLGCEWLELPIAKSYASLEQTLTKPLQLEDMGIVQENLQSRTRGLLLMAFSNRYGSLLLTTGNKDEYATGYATLYGDMCGGLAPIADLVKGEVYALARHYNSQHELIPERIITRPPSAELKPDQKDQDTLPEYDVLDKAVRKVVESAIKPKTETEKWLLGAIFRSEFKRRQSAPILKVSARAFGLGRRWPIAHRARV